MWGILNRSHDDPSTILYSTSLLQGINGAKGDKGDSGLPGPQGPSVSSNGGSAVLKAVKLLFSCKIPLIHNCRSVALQDRQAPMDPQDPWSVILYLPTHNQSTDGIHGTADHPTSRSCRAPTVSLDRR